MAYQCPKSHTDLKRSTSLIKGHTINHCVTCSSFNIDGTRYWPTGTLQDPVLQRQLCAFADERQEAINRFNEFLGADANDPRIEVTEW
jgi:hypothetical protein